MTILRECTQPNIIPVADKAVLVCRGLDRIVRRLRQINNVLRRSDCNYTEFDPNPSDLETVLGVCSDYVDYADSLTNEILERMGNFAVPVEKDCPKR